ncbi:hypothetical protein O6P37_19970 [Mycobacterium sp. CPCC 205372]|uniref:Uncharacterized protein n=1 Tax=Mycobacterium hippophais TaxID=3016340 RepID=A0ABT4PX62_9MYCO|nr:hypothetical protein [Mycobacterium hippophais]MCZ8381151.1 hypothetical protein [Mycobacterium hippophais]
MTPAQMPGTGAGSMPENLAFGAALSSLSFFCTAVMSALVRATEDLTSTAVILRQADVGAKELQ